MRSELAFLLDEHYPGRLADTLTAAGVDTVAVTAHRPGLRGADDTAVLRAAVQEGRIVVTEDGRTFGVAAAAIPDHLGIVFCHPARFPRTRSGLVLLHTALVALAQDPPVGLGEHPIEWWLERHDS